MKEIMILFMAVVLMILAGSARAAAQQQTGGQMPMAAQVGQPTSPQPMMGMMGAGQMDPKASGRMLQLHGEILKAVGEVMIKHGKAMEKGK